jgi:hypothetical protein
VSCFIKDISYLELFLSHMPIPRMVPTTPQRWTQLPLPIYRKTFEHIMEAFKLPHSFLDVVRRGTTALVKVPLGGNAGLLDSEGEDRIREIANKLTLII